MEKKKVNCAKGIKAGLKDAVHYLEFGKFMINMKYLDKNILIVKYKSYAPIPTLKRVNVSDDFKTLINNIFTNSKIIEDDMKNINMEEKLILDKLVNKSGLKEILDYDRVSKKYDTNHYINRFRVLQGEIVAGNNNDNLLLEVKEVLKHLKELKVIDRNEYESLITDLN